MILYRDRSASDRKTPPPWLEGAADLVMREDAEGRLWAIGNPLRVGPAPDRAWTSLEDGWQVRQDGDLDTLALARPVPWVPMGQVADQDGRKWQVPLPLSADGDSRIACRYGGPLFLPKPTPEQQTLEEIARSARAAVLGDEMAQEVPRQAACVWTAALLAVANHLSPEVVSALDILEDVLIRRVLQAASGALEES